MDDACSQYLIDDQQFWIRRIRRGGGRRVAGGNVWLGGIRHSVFIVWNRYFYHIKSGESERIRESGGECMPDRFKLHVSAVSR